MLKLLWALPLVATVVAGRTAAVAAQGCTGDCNGSGAVTINEIATVANIALGVAPLSTCSAGDADNNGRITIDEVLGAVDNAVLGCPVAPTPTPVAEEACPDRNPLRNVYFGDLHVHTTYSFDAYLWDLRNTPSDAYRFAKGESVSLPPLDAQGSGTRTAQLERPLDFTAVTDHSEFLGEVETCTVPGSAGYDSPTCQQFRAGGDTIYANIGKPLIDPDPLRSTDICGPDRQGCHDAAGEVWSRMQDAAAAAYDRCRFTSFVAYEYSRAFSGSTMHRNVIFRSAQVPFPISTFEEPTPQGLWRELHTSCIAAGNGCDVIAIPHNSNESNGRMFFVEYPGAEGIGDERVQAAFRAEMEPLVEVYQHKGNSECFNGLSGILGAPDEQCEFEKRRQEHPVLDCGNHVGSLGAVSKGCVSRLDYARGALLAGLQEEERLGVNPYQLGFIGSTDTHNGTPGHTEEWNFMGHQGANDASPAVLLGAQTFTAGGVIFSPGGLAAVWAEENSRSSLFDALRRRETFATSGTRLTVRVFGAWDLPDNLCGDTHLTEIGYAQGVPMGGILGPRPDGTVPTFVINAMRDPGTDAHPGTQLQRLQVIKGWIADGQANQRVYDVAGTADNGATVDLDTCTPHGAGADTLCTVWRDQDFDPAQRAFYYVRVLENPTCRWSTWLCNALPPDQRQPSCDDQAVPKTIQERAWTSPIWYTP